MSKEAFASTVREKLRLLKSPLIDSDDESENTAPVVLSPDGQGLPNLNHMGDRVGPVQGTPEFRRHEDASILELFFDLFFAANYTVFSQTQSVTSEKRFQAYIGYFCLLWMTWLVVGLYDVRFVTDSIFERMARAVHLGVMVGFAVVAPNFDPSDQDRRTMQTMSLILMVSRLCLAVEYASILWHVRRFKKAHLPLYIQIGLNVVAAVIYLGISFRFRKENSHVFLVWYIVSVIEGVTTMVLPHFWSVLSFTRTHLMKRMSLLTVIILGDGIVLVAQNVVTIVKSPDAWNSLTIGIVTAATATIYFVFLIYFDWMKHEHLPPMRQQIWTLLHFPFHLALVLFMQGFTQFIIWSKIIDVLNKLTFDSILNNVDEVAKSTSLDIQTNLSNLTYSYFALYPPTYYETWQSVDVALSNVTQIDDGFWPQLAEFASSEGKSVAPNETAFNLIYNILDVISSSMANALFENFKIDLYQEVADDSANETDINGGGFQSEVSLETWDRYMLVFAYGYVAAGATLAIMTILTIVSRVRPWKPWHMIRTVINFLLALGVGLVALLYYHPARANNYLFSPWVLPTITIVWVVVLLLTHIRNAPPLFFPDSATSAKDPEQHQYGQVVMVPLVDQNTIARKPVGGGDAAQEWDLGMHQRQGSSYVQQAAYEGLANVPYNGHQEERTASTHTGRVSPEDTAYDSYQSSTEFRTRYN